MDEASVALDVTIRDSAPADVRSWWWTFPDAYVASDPAEQPFRVETEERSESRVELSTWWRTSWGRTAHAHETHRLASDTTWTAWTELWGVAIHDEYVVEPVAAGTRLRIDSTLIPVTSWARLTSRWLLPRLRVLWRDSRLMAAQRCELETPSSAAPAPGAVPRVS